MLILFAIFLYGCNKGEKNNSQDFLLSEEGFIPIMAKPKSISSSELNFDPGNIIVEIDACSSGYTATLTVSDVEASLYIGDYNCRAKVLSFTSNSGEVFTIKAGVNFAFGFGGVTPFVSNLGNEASVVTEAVLSSPLLATDSIGFSIYRVDTGSDLEVNPGENVIYISSATVEVTEGDSVKVSYTIKKVSEQNTDPLVINYSLSGSALAGEDYITPPGSVIMPASSSEVAVEIDLINDSIGESIETLSLTIDGSSNYYAYGRGDTIIYDEDSGVSSTNLVMHLTPSSISNSAGSVDMWSDLSVGTQTVQQTVAGERPSFASGVVNGFDGVNFDGVNDLLDVSGSPLINQTGPFNEKKIFVVFETGADVLRRQIVFEQGGGSNCILIYIDGGRLYYLVYVNGMSSPAFLSTPISQNTVYHATLDYNALASNLTAYLYSSNIGSVSGVSALGNHGSAGIGGSNGNKVRFHDSSTAVANTNFEGIVSEVIYYNDATDTGTIASVQNYLADKYAADPVMLGVSSESSTVSESGGDSTNFIFTKSRPQSFDVTIDITVGGSAASGTDYQAIPSSIVIPAFSTSVSVALVPIDDNDFESGAEYVTITVLPSADFEIGQQFAKVDIVDDDSGSPIGDYVMWLSADLGVQTIGSNVTGWLDQSSYGQTISQISNTQQPTLTPTGIAGRNSIAFDGIDDWMAVASSDEINSAAYGAKSIGLVVETSMDVTSRQVIYEQGGGTRGMALYLDAGNLYFHVWGTSAGDHLMTASVSPSTSYRLLGSFNSVTGELKFTINDVETVSSSGVGMLAKHTGAVGIGRQNGKLKFHDGVSSGSFPFGGKIADLILYNKELSAPERSSLLLFYGLNYP